MLRLRYSTPPDWTDLVRDNLDAFLQDHAANERKVSGSALSLAVQHPEKQELVSAMIALAQEELDHFRRVHEILVSRGASLGFQSHDPYMTTIRKRIRTPDTREYLLDRLILFGIVEARGCERFALLAEALEPGPLQDFYRELVRSEARHHATYLSLARVYFDPERVAGRLDELLDLEADVARGIPLRPALH